ncbi:MAG: class I adenylate-forming enzyme family protein [Gemmatimonadota bacterium]
MNRRDNLGYWYDEALAEHPDRVCLIDLSGASAREITYRELDARMNRVATLITEAGLCAGDRIAMAIGNRFEFVEIMYGAMRAGVVPVPLNTRQGADVLDYIIRDAACEAAFVEPAACPKAEAVIRGAGIDRCWILGAPQGRRGRRPGYEEVLLNASSGFDSPRLGVDHPAFQPYTSGSTGRPKGVVLTHEGQLWWVRCLQKYWPTIPEARALAAVPLYHKNAMAGAIKPLLQAGGSVVLLPNFEPERFLRTLAEYRCTTAGGVPAVFTLLLQHRDLIDTLDLSALESLKLGSAPVQEQLLDEVEAVFGVSVGESYGLTEGGPVMIGPPVDGGAVPRGSCGVAWPEGEVKLVGEAGAESQTDGELYVRNPGVTPGYYNLPETNAARLADGWLATGDLFHCDTEGFFYFRGRTDDMFNSGGENIYPKEVENLLLAHPDVADAAVVPIRHDVKGHVPVAMVLLRPGARADEAALKTFALEEGPAYAHPRRIILVNEMPLSGAGKVDRAAVTDAFRTG